MFERFTPRARRAIVVAQEEAKALNHSLIGPEHLLLGLVQGDGIAAIALGQLGVSLDRVRGNVTATVERAKTEILGAKIPFSPQAKRVLELSLREALRLGHNYIGTEHLVLGALGVVDQGAATQLLGVAPDDVRARVLEAMPTGRVADPPRSPAAAEALRLASKLAGSGPMTTGHLLLATVADVSSLAHKALAALGITTGSLESPLSTIPIGETSDAPPRPQVVEIRLGESTTTIGDPDLAAALGGLSPERLREVLRDGLLANPDEPDSETGS
jgi:ATP-dependent Clp protease ATP-binding subunit ClpA